MKENNSILIQFRPVSSTLKTSSGGLLPHSMITLNVAGNSLAG
jgi:hypothetical protein